MTAPEDPTLGEEAPPAARLVVLTLVGAYGLFAQSVVRAALRDGRGSPIATAAIAVALSTVVSLGFWLFRGGLKDPFSEWHRPSFLVVRAVAVTAWGWFCVSTFRTMHYGLSVQCLYGGLLVVLLFVVPLLYFATAGLRPLRQLVLAAAIAIGSLVLSEVTAGVEEALFRQQTLGTGTDVNQNRWWPFEHHALIYEWPDGYRATD